MASASSSPSRFSAQDQLRCLMPPGKGRDGSRLFCMPDMMRSSGFPRIQFIFDGKTAWRVSFAKGKRSCSAWKDIIDHLGSSISNGSSLRMQHKHLIKTVVTVESKFLVLSDNGHRCDSSMQFGSNSDFQALQSSIVDSDLDEREKLRRMRISKANKGNVPWNKGKKHSPETVRRIRERTRIALQDQKVKMKLVTVGHAQSESTRVKIGVGMREVWQRRRERLMVLEGCFSEWQNMIAEASRKGLAGEEELQWDSYKILDEQLKQEWQKSVEKRKNMPRPKGNKRAPKSPEQRKKISEAIAAKWTDPGYRKRVYAALTKYHGTPAGVGKKPARKQRALVPSEEKVVANKKRTKQPKVINSKAKSFKKATPRKKRSTPSYKDPMSGYKLEMIKKIRSERATMETKKKEATERAKLLISEAEKAAEALKVAARKSPLARASLAETRKLIAEAIRSIESIEIGQKRSQDNSGGTLDHPQAMRRTPSIDSSSDMKLVNGSRHPSMSNNGFEGLGVDKMTLQNAQNDRAVNAEGLESVSGYLTTSSQPNNLRTESSRKYLSVDQSKVNGSVRYNLPSKEEKSGTSCVPKDKPPSARTKKWVCGRLVDVEEG